jgi:hypothetical protein
MAVRLVGGSVARREGLFRRFVDTGVPIGPKNLLFGVEPVIEVGARLIASSSNGLGGTCSRRPLTSKEPRQVLVVQLTEAENEDPVRSVRWNLSRARRAILCRGRRPSG